MDLGPLSCRRPAGTETTNDQVQRSSNSGLWHRHRRRSIAISARSRHQLDRL